MKKILFTSLLLVGLIAGFAYAHGNGGASYGNHMRGGNYGMMGGSNGMMGGNYGMMSGLENCPGAASWAGQDGWDAEKQQKFLSESSGLRKEMNDKRFEYVELQRNPETTQAQLTAIEKQMVDLHEKLGNQANSYK